MRPEQPTDQQEQEAIARVEAMVYRACRQAVTDELLVYHAATVVPMLELVIEMQKSLGLILSGQTLVEKTLAELGTPHDDGEAWRESLGDD